MYLVANHKKLKPLGYIIIMKSVTGKTPEEPTFVSMTMESYVQKLAEGKTNGYNLAIKLLCEIFGVSDCAL